MLYYCNVCIITTRNLHDFNKHLLTKKHIKNKTKQVYDNSFNVTVSSVNECNVMLTISDIPNTTAQSERATDKNPKCNYCNMKDANDTSKSDGHGFRIHNHYTFFCRLHEANSLATL